MQKRFIFLAIICSLCKFLSAQNHVEADRPSESVAPATVGQNKFQAELGIRREMADTQTVLIEHPQLLLRFGLLSGLELRAELQPQTRHDRNTDDDETGLAPVKLGLKTGLWKGKGIIPEAALLADIGIPGLASRAFSTSYAQPRFRLLLENEITKDIRIGWNLGAEWEGESTKPSITYSLSPEYTLGKHWELFAEIYGSRPPDDSWEHVFDSGLSYFIGSNSKLDLSGGIGLTASSLKNFVSIGYTRLFGH
jgi:hypothetical protein